MTTTIDGTNQHELLIVVISIHRSSELRGTVNIAFIDNDSTHDTLCIMVDVRYGRLTVPILETPVRVSPFHIVFLTRHQSTQRLDPFCTIRDTDNAILSDPSSHRYCTETRILAAAIVIATR